MAPTLCARLTRCIFAKLTNPAPTFQSVQQFRKSLLLIARIVSPKNVICPRTRPLAKVVFKNRIVVAKKIADCIPSQSPSSTFATNNSHWSCKRTWLWSFRTLLSLPPVYTYCQRSAIQDSGGSKAVTFLFYLL